MPRCCSRFTSISRCAAKGLPRGAGSAVAAVTARRCDCPTSCCRFPTFNEGALVERAIANAIRLDWPADKLHIQICDDSTDNTTEIARAAAARAVALGFDVAVLSPRRPRRISRPAHCKLRWCRRPISISPFSTSTSSRRRIFCGAA